MANDIIRTYCNATGTHLWQIACLAGHSDQWFCKLMRNEFPKEVQLCLVDAMEKSNAGEKYDLSAWKEWRDSQYALAQAKRIDGTRKRADRVRAWKRLNDALDEAEQRRIEGGWDTWQG